IDLGVNATYPLIAGGKVFVVLPTTTGATSDFHSTLIAFDAVTGHVAWGPIALPSSTYGWAAICYENGRVFMNTGGTTSPVGGLMAAYSATNGAMLWSTTLPGQYSFSTAPTALNGYVYTSGAGSSGTLYCVRESDGTVAWTGGVENGDSSSPAVTANGVYAGYACGQTFGFSPLSGAPLWHLSTGCEGGGGVTSAFYNNLVFIRDYYPENNPNHLHYAAALDSTTGGVVKLFADQGAMAFDNNMVFGIVNNALTATNIATWTNAWTVNNAVDAPITAPTVINGIVYVGTVSGKLQGYDENSAKLVASVDLGRKSSLNSESRTDMAAGGGLMVIPSGTHLIAVGAQFALGSLTANPQVAIGGANISVTATLTKAAPADGAKISLISSDAHLIVPTSITIPAGALSVSFNAQTLKTNNAVRASMNGSLNGLTITTPISLLPDGLVSFKLSPSTSVNGGSSTGTVALAYPAPSGGVTVYLGSAFAPLAQPSITYIVIPAGQTTGTFKVITGTVLSTVPVNISARVANSNSLLQAITLTP
ncbi:MAG: hypothetical protein JWQ02_2613, partial [Capsulimonas sp.]|nr:hypothetical protein [Capsulimonas sp.]